MKKLFYLSFKANICHTNENKDTYLTNDNASQKVTWNVQNILGESSAWIYQIVTNMRRSNSKWNKYDVINKSEYI